MSNGSTSWPGSPPGIDEPAPGPVFPGSLARTRRRLLLGTLFLNLLVFSLVGQSLYHDFRLHVLRAQTTTSNLAKALENEIAGSIRMQDLALQSVIDEYQHQKAAGGVDRNALDTHIRQVLGRLPEADALRIADAEGNLVYGSDVTASTRVNVADRPHFIKLRDTPGLGLVFSRPQVSRINKKWVVLLARRVDLPDGRFGGMAFIAITLDRLSRTFSALDIGQRGLVVLRDADLGVVVRYPEMPAGMPGAVGKREVSAAFRSQIQAGHRHGVFTSVSPVDGIERYMAFNQVNGYPFYILLGLATDEHMATWRKDVVKHFALLFVFAVVTSLAAWLLHLVWRRQLQSMEALSEQEAKFRTVADYTQDWEYWQGPDGAIRYMTPSCAEATGYTREEFTADPELLRRIVHKDDRHLFDERPDAGPAERQLDFRIVRRDGAVRWMSQRCIRIFGASGVCRGRRIGNRDITERKAAEFRMAEALQAAENASRAKSTFLANMSHELRTPLNGIMGMTSLALRRSEDPKQIDQLSKVLQSSERLLAIINDVLDFSDLDAERLTIEQVPFGVGQVMEQLTTRIADKARNKGLRVQISLPPGLPDRLFKGDPVRLGQVLFNLVGNAVKFSQSGSIVLDASLVQEDADGVVLRWEVRDTGIGIRSEDLPRLFTPFEQADNSSTRAHGGTGLGLALSKRLVPLMGGEIGVDSSLGQGSTFWFTVRLGLVPAPVRNSRAPAP